MCIGAKSPEMILIYIQHDLHTDIDIQAGIHINMNAYGKWIYKCQWMWDMGNY